MEEDHPRTGNGLLLTGYTGFLGSRLAAELLRQRPDQDIVALVRESALERAQRVRRELTRRLPSCAGRIQLVVGDLRRENLGLPQPQAVAAGISEIFHLAALYDLSCPAAAAVAANVEGTCRVLDFATHCPGLRRFHYTSTCYVAGDHHGLFGEDDLDLGQRFLNHYDRSKYLAEMQVRARMDSLPTTIYRPAIIVGDSHTGEIPKFDGPYFVMNAMSRLPRRFVFFRIGSGRSPVNLVPIDFVARAMAFLSNLDHSLGRTYQLADPAPWSSLELAKSLMACLDRRLLLLPIPAWLARALLRPRPLQRLLGLPASATPYFDYGARFDTRWTQRHLAATDIYCPPLGSYLPRLVTYWRAHRKGASPAASQFSR